MDLTEEHKKEVERRIVETTISALEHNQITEDQYDDISKYILEKIDSVKTHHDLMVFLRELTQNWNMFSFVLTLENGEVKSLEEKKAVEKVEQLAEGGKIEDALEAAKQAVNNSGQDTQYGS